MTDPLTTWILARGARRYRPLLVAFMVPYVVGVGAVLLGDVLTRAAAWLALGLVLTSWPVAVWVAAQPTAAALRSDRLMLLRLSNTPEPTIIQSLIVEAVLRLRLFAAVTLGCVPPLALAWVHLTTDAPWEVGSLVGVVAVAVPVVSLHGGILFTLAAHGVAMAVRLRSGLVAIVSGLSAGLVAMLPAAVVILIVFNAAARMFVTGPRPLLVFGALLASAVGTVLPLAISRTVLAGVRMRGLPQELPRVT